MSIYRFDSVSYLEIAKNAPLLPTSIDVCIGHPEISECSAVKIPHHHAQRFIGPWLIGMFAKALGIAAEHMFLVMSILIILLSAYLLFKMLQQQKISLDANIFITSLYILSPYVGRFYLAVPTYLPDLLFLLGSLIIVKGLIEENFYQITLGSLIASAGRQTAVMWVPALVYYFWKQRNKKAARVYGVINLLILVGMYKFTSFEAEKMNAVSINTKVMMGGMHWLLSIINLEGNHFQELAIPLNPMSSSQNTLMGLGGFILRAIFPFLLLMGLIKFKIKDFNVKTKALILSFLAIIAQPLLAGPLITGSTVGRLTALALPSAIGIMALSQTPQLLKNIFKDKKLVYLMWIFLFISSYHHRTFLVDLGLKASPIFFISQVIALLGMLSILTYEKRTLKLSIR
ncbi:MAG: hypothetical protein IPM57_00635 [Oligoflexia bacterium]|nr:hypothetical protein [Oligoflexia bacterium]